MIDLYLDGFFRRRDRSVSVITEEIMPGDDSYKFGFRFRDHRGNKYRHDGSITSQGNTYLDLIEEIPFSAIITTNEDIFEEVSETIGQIAQKTNEWILCEKLFRMVFGTSLKDAQRGVRLAAEEAKKNSIRKTKSSN
jgi:hypothetical protein